MKTLGIILLAFVGLFNGCWPDDGLPPEPPHSPQPVDGVIDTDWNVDLSWSAYDPDDDILFYNLYFGTESPPTLKQSGLEFSHIQMTDLLHGQTYYWQVEVKDSESNSTKGPVWSFTTLTDYVSDPRDQQQYPIVKIGNQVWMAENMNYNIGSGSWCLENDPSNCSTYGRLYNWGQAMLACPQGWGLPSDQDWIELEGYLGMQNSELSQFGMRETGMVGHQLKSIMLWKDNGQGNNSSGFNALPGGFLNDDGRFYDETIAANFWTSSTYGVSEVITRYMLYNYNGVYRDSGTKVDGLSVRCIRTN